MRPTVRAVVIARDGLQCRHCGRRVVLANPGDPYRPDHLHLDHLIPWAMGGSDDADNLVVSCAGCNLGRIRPPAGAAAEHRLLWRRVGDERHWRSSKFRPPMAASHLHDSAYLFSLTEVAEILGRTVEDVLALILSGTLQGTSGTSRPIMVKFPQMFTAYVEQRMDELGWEE